MSDYKVPFVNYGLSYQKIKPEIDQVIQGCLDRGDLILRKDVEEFERKLAKFVGKKYAVGLNSGTDALYLSLKVLGIGPGDEVITSSHTFVSTIQVIKQLGATPVLVDLDEDWEKYETPKTKAVIPVHIAGEVSSWLPKWEHTVEDACQALGAKGVGKGIIQCYSFYPAKILGAYGDAGAITTNSRAIYDEIKELRNHYKKDYSKWGINSRMDNIQASILNVKIKYLPEAIKRRREIAKLYFSKLPMKVESFPEVCPGRVWQDFIIRTVQRDELYDFLKENGIETIKNEYHFPIPKLPKSVQYEKETLRLPIYPGLTDEQVSFVVEKIKEFYD